MTSSFKSTHSFSPDSNLRSATVSPLIPKATLAQAIRITRSGFQDTNRVGTTVDSPQYYRFTLGNRALIRISVKNNEAGGIFSLFTPTLQFSLQQSNGRVVGRQTSEGGEVEAINRTLGRGTYYVRVTSGGESVPFTLGVQSASGLFR